MNQFNPLASDENMTEESRRNRNAAQIAITQLISTILAAAFVLFFSLQSGAWQLYVTAGALVLLSVLFFSSLQVIRNGRTLDGARWMLTGITGIMLLTVFLFEAAGFLLGPAIIVFAAIIAFRTLPAKSAREIMMVAVPLGLLTLAAESLNLQYRLNLAGLNTFGTIVTILVVTILGVFGILSSRKQISQFWQASIRNRLTIIVAGSALLPVILVSLILGLATYYQVQSALTQEAFNKLTAVQTIKANQITTYLDERQSDMHALSETMSSLFQEALAKSEAVNVLKRDQINVLFETWDADVRDVASDPGVVAGVRSLSQGLQEMGPSQLRILYLGKPDLSISLDGSSYSSAHYEQHGFFKGYTSIHGYNDALLIDPAGNIVYSVNKQDAFGTNLLTGIYKDTNLAELYRELLSKPAGTTYIADVASFEDKLSMFIGSPIYDGGVFVGILAYQLPLDKINSVMQERTGQGVTGETYLIAMEDDGRITYRSDRTVAGKGQFVIGYDLTELAIQSMRDALAGQTGGQLTIGSSGDVVINAYRPLDIPGLNWAVFARITAAEALSPANLAGNKDFLTSYKENYGYYDILLVEPNGLVFYSVSHEADYGTNILTGEFKDTNFGALVSEIMETKSYEFIDFAPYAPSDGRPAAFFGIPVLDDNNNVQLVVAAQASLEQLGAIMAETTGLGETGETFILGPDSTRRTETRFLSDLGVASTILDPNFKINTVASRSVLAGESGQDVYPDYRGVEVMAVWSPIELTEAEGSRPEATLWGVIAKVDTSEALATVNQLARAIGLVVGLAVLIIGALAITIGTRFATSFVRPILTLAETASQVAGGNMDLHVNIESSDEVGTLSNAFNTMTSQLRDLIGSLETRIEARTRDLATVAEISTATGTILEVEKLLQEVVDLSKERFGLYHAHIYLLDEAGENLVLRAGAGEPGRIMAAEKRSIPLQREQSLVARAAREGKGVIVNDVTQAPDFLPNPLLPDTHAEMAVPMIVGSKVIGVFDVQSETIGRFTDADVNVKTTLAAQVATAIQNVRSFEQAKVQAELESLSNTIGQKIQRSTTVEDTLQIAIREVGLALGAKRVKVNLQVNRQENGNGNNN